MQLNKPLEAVFEAASVFEIAEDKVSDEDDIDLGQDGVFKVAKEGLVLEIVLDCTITVIN